MLEFFSFVIWWSIPLGFYRNKFRVILFTTVSLRSVLTWSAKISIFDTLYFFIFSQREKRAHKGICEIYDVDCLTEHMYQNLFKKFRSGDFSDNLRSGRSSEVDYDAMKPIIESNSHITLRQIVKQLNGISHNK